MSVPSHDGLDDSTVDLEETSPRSSTEVEGPDSGFGFGVDSSEASLILIAHPENKRLGKRFRIAPGATLEIGRARTSDINFPEVLSLSRSHGRLRAGREGVSIEDLGSTNGSFVNDRRVQGRVLLASGDRLQLGGLHFKFLYGRDVEQAYYEAIYSLVTQDGLTEIYNRRTFDEELEREVARCHRHHRPLSLILFDVDGFKLVNDRYGHLSGDFVLKGIVGLVRRLLRREQVFARVGGDEFAILNPETGQRGSVVLADKLRAHIADHEFDPDVLASTTRVACSFGVAELTPDMETAQEFFAAADRALYDSKKLGGNRVTFSSGKAEADSLGDGGGD